MLPNEKKNICSFAVHTFIETEMHNSWYMIINPTSAGGKAKTEWANIQAIMQQENLPFEAAFSLYPFHAIELAKQAIEAGYRKILAVGGDGTINEVINGIFSQKIVPPAEIEFSVVPLGTGSDWIKMYKIPRNYKKAIPQLARGISKKQDIGLVSYQSEKGKEIRYFANVAGMAFDASAVVKSLRVNKAGFMGQIYYLALILGLIPSYKSSKMIIQGDNFRYEGDVFCLNIGICKYSGGGMQTVPNAIADDGLFEITIIEKMPKLRIFWELRRLYLGTIHLVKDVVKVYQTTTLHVETQGFDLVETDGELLGKCPVTFSVLPQALTIRIPK